MIDFLITYCIIGAVVGFGFAGIEFGFKDEMSSEETDKTVKIAFVGILLWPFYLIVLSGLLIGTIGRKIADRLDDEIDSSSETNGRA